MTTLDEALAHYPYEGSESERLVVAAARNWHALTEKRIRQFAFDIVMTELGMDDSDPDDQADATDKVDTWMEHWRQGDTR